MKQLWQYIKNPQENCSYDFSIRAMAFSALLCLLVPLLFKFLTTAMFVMAGIEIPALTSDIGCFTMALCNLLRSCKNPWLYSIWICTN